MATPVFVKIFFLHFPSALPGIRGHRLSTEELVRLQTLGSRFRREKPEYRHGDILFVGVAHEISQ
jgi:hypothetical protein